MITAGVDIGSLSAEALIMEDNNILSYSIVQTGPDTKKTSQEAMDEALMETKLSMDDIEYVVATGYGRLVVPFAQKQITEIGCHGRGANWLIPSARTILDMGGQDCKAIRIDEKGKVVNFAMNDKCAAGAGRSMEIMAKLLDVSLEEIGELSLSLQGEPATLNDTCVLFTKSDAIALLREDVPKSNILAGCCDGLVNRVVALLKRVGIEGDFCIQTS